jgi:hypothetical protein
MTAAERQQQKANVERQRQTQQRRAEQMERRALEAGQALFDAAQRWPQPGAAQPPAMALALAYFAARGCPLDQVPNLDRMTFRFSHSTEWWKGAEWETVETPHGPRKRKTKDGPFYPALHSSLRTHCGFVTACHVTWLDPIRAKKAPLDPAKMMRGQALGSVISISKGPSAKDPWIPQAPGMVAIAEGIETAATIAIAVPEARVWAAGSLAGIGRAPVNMECVGEIVVCRDNNHGNQQAQRQLEAALDQLEAHGKPLTVIASPQGDDFNDLAQIEMAETATQEGEAP